MTKSNNETQARQTPSRKEHVIEYAKLIGSTLLIVFLIRNFFISTYQIPTGSMESTLYIGDHIIANKFVYGIRTPDWIGIPYTRIGFHTPFIQLPSFREPKQGDIVIFKYPQDTRDSYVKRCVAVSGDTVEVRAKALYVNGERYPDPPYSQYVDWRTLPKQMEMPNIFPPHAGNRDYFGPVRIPAPGDKFEFKSDNKDRWYEWLTIMLYEGHKIELKFGAESRRLTVQNQQYWDGLINQYNAQDFYADGKALDQYIHTVHNQHYFMMGDNRDNSLDSRYWGFVPQRWVLGEPIVIYWSWNKKPPLHMIHKKIRMSRFLRLVH